MATAEARIEHLGYAYPTWSDRGAAALYDIDLELGPGLTVVGGDSGAGKSTLLRVLNGLVPHFHGGRIAGRAMVAGLDVLSTPTRRLARHVGFVFQEPERGFVRGTVTGEVAFAPENLGLPRGRIRDQVAAALDAVGITALAGRRLATLSGGERQRVALAAALAGAPEFVVLDEPTSQLDDAGVAGLAALAGDLAAAGRAVVVSEHRVDRFPAATRVLAVAGGRLVEPVPRMGGRPSPSAPAWRTRGINSTGGGEVWSLQGVTAGMAGRAIVADVELSGAAGEVLVLTGANGAGKTTLLRTIAGLLAPLTGRVTRRPGRVAYLPQDPGVLLHRRSVRAELAQTLRWSHSSEDPELILGLLGLSGLAERDPRDLSGGQRQRAALAAVLVGGPSLVLLDEPTRGMDAAARAALAGTLHGLAGQGASVVLATHDRELAGELADRVVEVGAGRVAPVAAPGRSG